MANLFETEIMKSLKSQNWYTIKVPVASCQGISFLNRAPFDFFAIRKGIPFSFEAKMCKSPVTSFPLDRLEAHQIENLIAFGGAGGRPYILVSFRKPKPTAYAISIEDWMDLSKELVKEHKRKSVPRAWFDSDKRFIKLPRTKFGKTYGWDVSDIPVCLTKFAGKTLLEQVLENPS